MVVFIQKNIILSYPEIHPREPIRHRFQLAQVVTGEVGILQVSEGDFTKAGLNAAFNLQGPLWVDLLWEKVIDGDNIGAGGSWGLGISYSY